MDRQLIKTLIDALQASGLDELEYSRDGETLRLSKGAAIRQAAPSAATGATSRPPPAPLPVLDGAPELRPGSSPAAAATASAAVAPLCGIVHLQRAPGAAPFVTAGQGVEAGQVLCTVEAMKVFTEVRAGRAGTVEAILVADGQEVEPGQALVRLA